MPTIENLKLLNEDAEASSPKGRASVGLTSTLVFTLCVAVVFDVAIQLAATSPGYPHARSERVEPRIRIIHHRR
jgi:hypothetical protein